MSKQHLQVVWETSLLIPGNSWKKGAGKAKKAGMRKLTGLQRLLCAGEPACFEADTGLGGRETLEAEGGCRQAGARENKVPWRALLRDPSQGSHVLTLEQEGFKNPTVQSISNVLCSTPGSAQMRR